MERNAHVVDFCWNEDGSEIAFTTKPTPEFESAWLDGMTLERIDMLTAETHLLSKSKKPIKHLYDTNGLCWLRDWIYFVAGRAWVADEHSCC